MSVIPHCSIGLRSDLTELYNCNTEQKKILYYRTMLCPEYATLPFFISALTQLNSGTWASMLVEFHNSRFPFTTASYSLLQGLTEAAILKYGIQLWMPVQALWFKFSGREHNYEQLALWPFEVTSFYSRATCIHAHKLASTHERKRKYNSGLQSNYNGLKKDPHSVPMFHSRLSSPTRRKDTRHWYWVSLKTGCKSRREQNWEKKEKKKEIQGWGWIADDWNRFFIQSREEDKNTTTHQMLTRGNSNTWLLCGFIWKRGG